MTIIIIGSCVGGGSGGGGVESVTGTPPVVSSGGANPNISLPPATAFNDGYMTQAQVALLEGLTGGLIPGVAGEALGVGVPVYARRNPGTGAPEFMRAAASPPLAASEVIGLITVAALVGEATTAVNGGALLIPDSVWDPAPPTTFDVGERVYLSSIVGKLTLTPPTIDEHIVQRLGWVIVGGAGSVRMAVEFDLGTIL